MTITPTLTFDLSEQEEKELNQAISTLIKYRNIFSENEYKTPESFLQSAIQTLCNIKDWDIPNLEKQIER